MLRNYRGLVASAIVVFAFTAVSGCRPGTSQSTLSTTIGQRTVKAVIDSGAGITSKDDNAIVSFGTHTITVAKDQVLLDGAKVADIPADAKLVTVEVNAGVVKVKADDGAVATATMK
jgi:hypothetical protein